MAEAQIKEPKDLETILAKIDFELRNKALKTAVRAAGNVVKTKIRQLTPRGDAKHRPELPPLWKSIITKVKGYRGDQIWVAIVGASWPDGTHFHLVDGGHEVKVSRGERKGKPPLSGTRKVAGKKMMATAIDTTMQQQDKAILDSLAKSIEKASKG